MYDPNNGTMDLYWDANGNLAQVIGCKQNSGRLHEWDVKRNSLRFVLGEKYAGYYGYDANGERVYKLTGISNLGQVNSGSTQAQAILDDAVLYPNPYMVVTPKGYTKHYYAGAERLATVIGGGGFGDMESPIDSWTRHEKYVLNAFNNQYKQSDPFWPGKVMSYPVPTEDISGKPSPELEYQCKPTFLDYVDVQVKWDILLGSIAQYAGVNNPEKDIFFSHGDHLGSANWITDGKGKPIQYIHYAPYGELIANKHDPNGYNERYKFTGKERDWETCYDYFGARYWWLVGTWLSVDPLSDKYPQISPYAYCMWNPVRYIDPDGRDIYTFDSDGNFTGNVIKQDGDHIGRIYLSSDKYMDFSFNDQSYADRICELYSDKYFSLAGQNNPDLSPITHVSIISNDQINSTLPLKDFKYLGVVDFVGGVSGGLVGALAYACGGIGSLSYAFWESRGGKLDFVNNGLIRSTANALFLPTDGKKISYDSFDFGNYLWGQSMRRMGIGYGLSVFGAHADCLIHTGKLDSKADQRAIRNGYMFNMRR